MSMNRTQAAIGTIVFFFLAPGIVAGVMPWWISGWRVPTPLPVGGAVVLAGAVAVIAGLVVLIDSFVRFARKLGTPAPVAPTEALVIEGYYRFVRNPMYVAVLAIILGQALMFWSLPVALYAIVVFLAVHLFVVGYEEPVLRERFPADYAAYSAAVRRWLPRPTPWRG